MKDVITTLVPAKLTLLTHLNNVKLYAGVALLQIMPFVQKYLFSDFTFLKWLVIAMVCDLLTGVVKAWNKKEAITSKGLRQTISKCVQYGVFLIITNVLTHYEINGQAVSNFTWLTKLAYEFVILIEIKSVYENIVDINPKLDLFKKVFKKIAELWDNK